MQWIVCQIGARENYAIARALHRKNKLAALITDTWSKPDTQFARFLPDRIRSRTHPELADATVFAPTVANLLRETTDRVRRRQGWQQMISRNEWFSMAASKELRRITSMAPHTVFSYSYAAKDIFTVARQRGWRTILGQIDPGPVEARLVDALYSKAGEVHETIPDAYWDNWRQETELADIIVVNSSWSRQGLIAEGISERKIRIVPLAFEGAAIPAARTHPAVFTNNRPLRLLFLGLVSLRKGIEPLFEAMRMLEDVPIELDIVGSLHVEVPEHINRNPRVRLHGRVPRSATKSFYQNADLFIFPTLSDGFGMTQLEALNAGVPVIASQRCGDVVKNGMNGVIVEPPDGETLAEVLRELASKPQLVAGLQSRSHVDAKFSLDALGDRLGAL